MVIIWVLICVGGPIAFVWVVIALGYAARRADEWMEEYNRKMQ